MDQTPTIAAGTAERQLSSIRWLLAIIAAAAGIAVLHFGQGILAPLALAALLYVLIVAFMDRLTGLRAFGRPLPRWLAFAAVLAVLVGIVLLIGNILAGQVASVSSAMPDYTARFTALSNDLGALLGPKLMAAINNAIAEADIGSAASAALGSAGATFGSLSLVILFLAFLLVDRGAIRRKLPHLVADPQRRAGVASALDAMGTGIQHYMWIKTAVSALTGLLSYGFMKTAGLNFAETWAVLIFLLNFIPTIGSIIGTVLPVIAALAQFTTFGPVLLILAGVGTVQAIIGNVVEPAMSSRNLNLSPFVIILSLTLWSVIWGIPGAFLAVPLTVCGAIICSHVPAFRPVAILLAGRVDGTPATPTAPAPQAAPQPVPPTSALGDDLAGEVAALKRDRATPRQTPMPPPPAPEISPATHTAEIGELTDWIAEELAHADPGDPESPLHSIRAALANLPATPEELRDTAHELGSDIAELAKKNPALAALAAAGIGLVLGRLSKS